MDTISHGFWAYLLFRHHPWVVKFVLGSVLVDVPFLLGGLWLIIQEGGLPDQLPLKVLELGSLTIIAFAFHSIIIWAIVFTIFYFFFKSWLPFAWGWGFHILIDIFTHISDGLPLFWPISPKVTIGLVSYWESRFHGLSFNVIQIALLILLFIYPLYIKKK